MTPVIGVLQAIIALLSLSLVIFTYERGLVPIYASGPTNYTLKYFVASSTLLGFAQLVRVARTWQLFVIALLLSLAPNAAYWVAVLTSRKGDPTWGPAVTHAAVLAPLVLAITSFIEGLFGTTPVLRTFITAITTYFGAIYVAQMVLPHVTYLDSISDSQIYLAIAGLAYVAWLSSLTLQNMFVPKNPKVNVALPVLPKLTMIVLFVAAWWSLHPQLASPILPHPLLAPYDSSSFNLRTLSAVQSVTGLIIVAEALPPPDYDGSHDEIIHSVRYLRASHSILGGLWTQKKVMMLDDEPPLVDLEGNELGDSIYSTFIIQEAVRMINSTAKAAAGKLENALIIGLGTGVSATSFMRHKIATTIVEIDPAVYDAARTYFALPDPGPGRVFLEDARGWVARRSARVAAGEEDVLFDFVVHDCFSGGGVPQHIYTLEFWDDVKKTIQLNGIIVVNFAGIIKSDASRMVIFTLLKSFGQCRAFHDSFHPLTPEQYEEEFINVVIFCTQSQGPLTFRKARRSDWLGSPLRRYVLKSLPDREVNLAELILSEEDKERFILADDHNPLGKLQEAQGHKHWSVMRTVLSDQYWEIF